MNKRIAILGAGESGIGAALLGKKLNYEVFLSDGGQIAADRKLTLEANGIRFEEGTHTLERLLAVDEVIKSPGIPDSAPVVRAVEEKGIPVISEIEFAFCYMHPDAKIIAITGTNGKTTTTLLAYHLLRSAGLDVALGGNVGVSLARLVSEQAYSYYVVEVSSFQLDGIRKFRPDVAVLLNITPDHLDRYEHDFNAYIASKFRITENLTRNECFIYCADSAPVTEEVAKRKIDACLFAISASRNNQWQAYLDNDHLIFDYQYKNEDRHHKIPVSEISLIGRHNMINTMAAVMSALWMELPISVILKGLKTFKNAPHRLEPVAEIDGVRFINDSKATNVDSVSYALEGIKGNIIWIAGGIDKGNDYSQIRELVRQKVKGLICLGKHNEPLVSYFGGLVPKLMETQKVEEAVKEAGSMASPGDVVLLSPACASFDLFRNYEDRGDRFKEAVHALVRSKKVKA